MKVLILSRYDDFRMLMQHYLSQQGEEVSMAKNLAEALTLIASNIPDLVVLDDEAVKSVKEAGEEIRKLAPGVTIRVA